MEIKKILIGAIGVSLLTVIAGLIYITKPARKMSNQLRNTDIKIPEIVSIDEVIRHPEKFNYPIAVVGIVTEIDKLKSIFYLGCEDVCIVLPVKYKGEMPEVGSNVTIRGEVKKAEGEKYIFKAH